MSERYRESERMLARALTTVPLGSQTFSKSRLQFPEGASPLFLDHGSGAHVFDVDGNEYVDLVCGLASVLLGYRDPDVDAAVLEQLRSGVTFSLPHALEVEVAERIVDMVPCAEQVRFGKNGSDATSAAIRLARAVTGRDHVAVCGYHGWHDWYIGSTTRNLGVPAAVRELTRSFTYNDLDSLVRALEGGDVAAVILEPMNLVSPADGFLHGVAELTHRHGALLVFDETVTGFRYAQGGAQELFGVTPDLATFGKGLGNGLPLSLVTGPADLMKAMEDIFFSSTFGGETLSLAAARAVLDKIRREPVIETLRDRGRALLDGVEARLDRAGLRGVVGTAGHPAWSFLVFSAAGRYEPLQLKTLFMQECLAQGILTLGSHNICYALTPADVDRVLAVYTDVFAILRDAIDRGDLDSRLRCEALRPVFRVRGG